MSTSIPSFSIVRGDVIRRIVHGNVAHCVDIIREAYIAHAAKRSVNPPSSILRPGRGTNSRIIALPAYVDTPRAVSGMKWIASYPDNIRHGQPRASAVVILNDADCGVPFACLEGSVISATRTAASAVLAAEVLREGERNVGSLCVIGAGLIARSIYRCFVGMGWRFSEVRIHDVSARASAQFAEWMQTLPCSPDGRRPRITSHADAPSAMRDSELVVFATVSARPYVTDPDVLNHCPVVLHISLRDLDPQLLLNASNVVDDIEHAMTAQTSLHLAETLTGRRDFVTCSLADLLTTSQPVPSRSRPIVFSPFGLGVLDVALGRWVYEQAATLDALQDIPDFFPSVETG